MNDDRQENENNFWKSDKAKAIYFLAFLLLVVGAMAASFFNTGKDDESGLNGAVAKGTTGNVQEIFMKVNGASYEPSEFTVEAGKPVKWVIDGTKAVGCTKYLLAQDIGVSKKLEPGNNVIEFTPNKKGDIMFSCSMGMVTGRIRAV